jgi:hypothetical protein
MRRRECEWYTSVALFQLESIVAVHSLKGGKGVDESGVGREAVKVGRSSIHLQLSCAGGEGKGGDRAAKRQCNGGRTVQLWLVADGRSDAGSALFRAWLPTRTLQGTVGFMFVTSSLYPPARTCNAHGKVPKAR